MGVASTTTDPPLPVQILPLKGRLAYDIAIPLTKPSLVHDTRKLSELKVDTLDAICKQVDVTKPFRVVLKHKFATTETEVHQVDIAAGKLPPAYELVAGITKKIIGQSEAAESVRGALSIRAGLRRDPLLR